MDSPVGIQLELVSIHTQVDTSETVHVLEQQVQIRWACMCNIINIIYILEYILVIPCICYSPQWSNVQPLAMGGFVYHNCCNSLEPDAFLTLFLKVKCN